MSEERVYHHIREGGKLTHIGCEVLPNMKPIDVVIECVRFKNQESVGGQKQDGFEAVIKGFTLPLWLNSTNKKRLRKFARQMGATLEDAEYIEKHINNLTVTLCAEECKDPTDIGQKTVGLRISPILPKQPGAKPAAKKILDLTSANFEEWKAWLGKPTSTLAMVMDKFSVTEAALEELKKVKAE